MKTTFEDRLLEELTREIERAAASEHRPAPARRRLVTRRRVTLGLAACAVAATAAVVLPGVLSAPGGSAAYAVEKNPDGTITVTFQELIDPAENPAVAERLRAAGARVSIDNPPRGQQCGSPRGEPTVDSGVTAYYVQLPEEPGKASPKKYSEPVEMRFTLRPGDTLIMEHIQPPERSLIPPTMMYTAVKDKAEPCNLVPIPDWGRKRGTLPQTGS